MLRQRIVTALVLAAGLIAAIFLLPLPVFTAVAAFPFILAAWEWSRLARFTGISRGVFTLLSVFLLAICGWWMGFLRLPADAVAVRVGSLSGAAGAWWLYATWLVRRYPAQATLWSGRWKQTVMGFLVIVSTWSAIVFLRGEPRGEWLIVILVASVVCADTGAYFVGRKWGRNKLAPAVSPGKSREGLYGGLACSGVFALLLVFGLGRGAGDWWLLVLIISASLASVMGDLLESMLKRQRGIKDSGTILPGHGGVLDRMDSITAAAPVFALAYVLSGWQL